MHLAIDCLERFHLRPRRPAFRALAIKERFPIVFLFRAETDADRGQQHQCVLEHAGKSTSQKGKRPCQNVVINLPIVTAPTKPQVLQGLFVDSGKVVARDRNEVGGVAGIQESLVGKSWDVINWDAVVLEPKFYPEFLNPRAGFISQRIAAAAGLGEEGADGLDVLLLAGG